MWVRPRPNGAGFPVIFGGWRSVQNVLRISDGITWERGVKVFTDLFFPGLCRSSSSVFQRGCRRTSIYCVALNLRHCDEPLYGLELNASFLRVSRALYLGLLQQPPVLRIFRQALGERNPPPGALLRVVIDEGIGGGCFEGFLYNLAPFPAGQLNSVAVPPIFLLVLDKHFFYFLLRH